jgi:hypothetical protein
VLRLGLPGRPCFERRPSAGLTLPMTGIAIEHMARAYVLDRDHRFCYVSGEPGAAALHRPPLQMSHTTGSQAFGALPFARWGPHDDGEETYGTRSGWRCHPGSRRTRGVPGGGAPIVMLQPWWHSLLGMCG